MHFVVRQRVHQVLHARDRVRRVLAVRELGGQLAEGVERIARGLRVALGRVLVRQPRHDAAILVEVGQALDVQRVVDVRVAGIELDETLGRGHRGGLLAGLVVGVGHFQLGLLRVAAVGKARVQRLVELDRLLVVARVEFFLGFLVKPRRRPADGGVVGRATQSTSPEDQGHQHQ